MENCNPLLIYILSIYILEVLVDVKVLENFYLLPDEEEKSHQDDGEEDATEDEEEY